ncbi:MAG: AAA family ATPase [Anaerolineales bacterium]|nr:AAA family ATPase [Anaerolineales bacterium]MCB8983599.1 AAA family ATPase [Ardenticatenaceae bacterium]
MNPLRLLLLGPPRLERDSQILEVDTRKATALLAYLALSGERPSRDWLAAFLWPETDDRRAKAALRRTLSALKTAVGAAAIFANREVIGLEADAVWCDVSAFQEAVRQGDLTTAVNLYRDDFLVGFSLRDSIPFDDWQVQQQESLRRDLTQALAQLAKTTTGETAVTHARRWCQMDPLREEAHRTLMRLLAANGRSTAALRQYRDCVRILDEELGVPPLPETTELYQAIQNDRVTQRDKVTRWQGDRVTENDLVTVSPPHIVTPSPLIGRDSELHQMQQLYQQVRPDGRLLIIEGEPGIGKTRLAEALVNWAAANDAKTLTARCYEGETNLAYAPLIQALQAGLTPEALQRLADLPAHHLAEAARLLPQLAEGRNLPPQTNLSGPGEQVRFYEGVIQTLLALLDGAAPGILWLDDVHWLDAASLELLLYLLHRWRERPLLTLFCWRGEELPANSPLPPLVAKLRRENACQIIQPHRFTQAHVAALLAATGKPFSPTLHQQLHEETEGLPMFVVAYLDALSASDGTLALPASFAVPASVRDLLHQRLAQINETERQILQTAAAIGHSFDLLLVQAASGRSDEETVTALEALTARGLLVEQIGRDHAAYDFSHDKLRVLVYEETGLARKRLLHRRLATTLVANRAPNAAVSAQIASHYQHAGLEPEAAAYFVQAGEQAQALFAHQDALHFYQAALALGADEPWRWHAACGALHMRLGNYPAALSALETAAAVAPAAELGALEHQLAQVYQRQGQWELAAHKLALARRHLGENAPAAELAQLILGQSLVAHRQKQAEAALALAQQAHALAQQAAMPVTLALAENILGILARHRGEMATAVACHQRSRALADDGGHLELQIAARNNLALTLGGMGQTGEAIAVLTEAIKLCQQYGDRHYEAALRSNLADMYHQAGAETAAQAQIRESVTIYAEIGRAHDSWQAEIWQLMEW